MKKTKISIAMILVMTVLFLAGCQSSAAASDIIGNIGGSAPALLTEAEARDIALKDAGFTTDSVTNLHIEKDVDDGVTKYEVDFRQGDYEYDYEVDAATGKIIGFDKDTEPVENTPAPSTPTSGTSAEFKAVTAEDAKKIALDHAGFKSSEVTYLTAEKDWDDGSKHYDVEFFKGDYEYDYEIDAATGKILTHSKEKEDDKSASSSKPASSSTSSSKTISKSKAKSIALAKAGLKESQVKNLAVKLDKDDGRTYYDVEFKYTKGNVTYEYDFEINAVSGKIVEWDKDIDD